MKVLVAIASVVLTGCPMCPTGEIAVVTGASDGAVYAGELAQLRATYGDWEAGPKACDGLWYVNHVKDGTAEIGTIDDCGLYHAPAAFVPGLEVVHIEASDFSLRGGCADCCAYATLDLVPR